MKFSIEELATDRQQQPGLRSWRMSCSWADESMELEFAGYNIDAELFRWYLENFATKDPLSAKKASDVENSLVKYQEKICSLLLVGFFGNRSSPVVLDILHSGDKSSFHSLPSEFLENSSQDQQLVVRRRAQATKDPLQDGKIQHQPETFNIFILAARSDDNDQAEYSQAALPIVKLLQCLPAGSSTVTLEIAAQAKNKQYHLVHLDVRKKVAYLDFSDMEETAFAVAKLLRQHEVIYSVINACESARADQGKRANLATIFTQGGIPHVFAMSYKVQISAFKILLDAYYGSFLKSGSRFAESAAVARKALRETRTRIGKFGVELELEDWIVPVVYTSSDINPGISNGQDLCAYLTFYELASGTPGRNQILTENWAIIARCVSVFRDAATLYENDEEFSLWDNAAQESEVRSIT
ncbi:hypothetical protein ACEPPN_014088 [Leptodophora sp. 'Broadleaf-Isolate-01']